MNWWDDALHRATAEVVLVGALAGLIGVQVVLRRLSFFTMALTHATFPGVVAASIIGINIVVFVLQNVIAGFTDRFAMAPWAIADGEYWRLITPVFLHSESFIFHIIMNSYILYSLGPNVEEAFGSVRFAVMYLAAGFMGNVLSFVMPPDVGSLGASGAVFGLIWLAWMNGSLHHELHVGREVHERIQRGEMDVDLARGREMRAELRPLRRPHAFHVLQLHHEGGVAAERPELLPGAHEHVLRPLHRVLRIAGQARSLLLIFGFGKARPQAC